jgi:hypothetical protein
MTVWRWVLGLGVGLFGAACTPTGGALGADGYEQALTKYRVSYVDKAHRKFLPGDWTLDNFAYDSTYDTWTEKSDERYRTVRQLDENGDGTVSRSERSRERLFDLRFVNSRDGAVIWLKVHPLEPTYSARDLEVMLKDYTSGLEGSGLFEKSTLFSLEASKARNYTALTVNKEATTLGPLPAIRSVIELAEVRSKAELVFAKVAYLETTKGETMLRWPVVKRTDTPHGIQTVYRRTGLLVIGYYCNAARFDSHVVDLRALIAQIAIPPSAVPPVLTAPEAAKLATTATPAPVARPPSTLVPSTNATPNAAPAAPAPSAPTAAPATTTPAPSASTTGPNVLAEPAPVKK